MRLPTRGKESDVDEAAAIEMIRYAIDQDVNYVDTAYVYHGGNGEGVVAKALAEGYRERVLLATKLPIWSVQTTADCDRIFQEQLDRLQTDHVDFYLLHCLSGKSWQRMRELGVPQWADKARAQGLFQHFGFSFHDTFDAFKGILDDYDWSFCQIQYNYACEDVQAGTRGLEYAGAKGVGIIVMEPLFGGTLASPPPPVHEIWAAEVGSAGPVDLALRWVWDKPEVSLVLSGMNHLDQVKQNVQVADRARVGGLSVEDRRLIVRLQEKYKQLSPVPCTKCGYCLPCPNGVAIPVNFELLNNATVFQGNSVVLCRNLYQFLPESQRASACLECGICEERCPQQIPIRETLAKVQQQFS